MTIAPEGRRMLRVEARNSETPIEDKPAWIKAKAHIGPEYTSLKSLVRKQDLHTVCEEAGCPNIFECWEDREATFLIGGEQCTRRCDFCQIDTGKPAQFGPGEDLSKYPRTFDDDLAICTREGVDLVFAPTPDVMYPEGEPGVRISAGPLGDVLEGQARPGHFDGMLTVVAKLMHLTRGDLFYFGQKDAQQLLLVRRMSRDVDFGATVVAVPTVRETDGLAMSSRNTYLSENDRQTALVLSRALWAGAERAEEGPSAVRRAAREVLVTEPLALVDYLVLVHPDTLEEVPEWYKGEALLAVAAKVGTTRLIDNTPVLLGPGGGALPVFSEDVAG